MNRHPGNVILRSMIDEHREEFVHASCRKVKRAIAMDIICDYVEEYDGRFLEESKDAPPDAHNDLWDLVPPGAHSDAPQPHPHVLGKVWVEAEPEKVLSKVMHRLRENKGSRSTMNVGKVAHSPFSDSTSGDEGPGKSSEERKCSHLS